MIVKNGNEVTSSTVIHRSVYKALTRQIRRGTKKPPEPTVDTKPDVDNAGSGTFGDDTL
jgi:hypothetical protein